jgi:hypothetical protein
MKRLTIGMAILACSISGTATAQTEAVTTPPPNLVVPNYEMVPVGPFGGLEGPASVARADDPSAAWFNPAGLTRQMSPQISGSAGVYSHTAVSPQALPNQGGSIQQLPNFVGFTLNLRNRLTVGAALVTNNAWNQETDAERFTSLATGQERFAYSADSEYSQRVAALSVGYRGAGGWRYGGGLAFSLMDLRLVQSASDRIGDATGLQTLLVNARISGSAFQMRGQGGVQYDVGRWRVGAAIRTPGLNVRRSGVIALDGVLDDHAGSLGASVFDADAAFDFRQPWELQAGVAFVGSRFQIEGDLHGYTAVHPYSLITTAQPTLTYGDAGAGRPPTVVAQPFQGLTSASDGILDLSAGGHILVTRRHSLRVHGGIASNRSPVGDRDEVFSRVDLVSWTVGASGAIGKFQFSVGFNRQRGTADDITVRNLLNGKIVRTRTDVGINGLVYQLAYRF